MTQKDMADLLEDALIEWRKRQTKQRNGVSLNHFAEYLGVSRPIVSQWLNRKREPNRKNLDLILPKLAELIGPEVYTQLGLISPDPILTYIIARWERLSPGDQHAILEQVEKYTTKETPDK